MTSIYVRQSEDKTGERAAVSRQLKECRAFCECHGWEVEQVFTDNDRSATTGRMRPGFEALLASNPKRIVVWHVDRLVRLSKDLERVIELGVNVHAVKSGHLDLSNPAGRAVAKTVTAWAQYEGEQKATRQRSANRQRAEQGIVLWTRRPYGFDREGSKVRIVPAEARVIREAARKVLKGATLASVVADLNRRGIPTSTGGRWAVSPLKRVLLNPRVAGRVVYNGEDLTRDPARTIIDAETFERLKSVLTDPRRRTAPSVTVKYLLSGLARCGRQGCDDAVMFATSNPQGVPVYRCLHCYGTRRLDLVDEVVMGVLVARLSRPDAAQLLSPDVDLDALRERVVDARDRRDALATLLADGLLSPDAVRGHAKKLTDEISRLERAIAEANGSGPLGKVVGADDVAAALAGLSLPARREIIRTLMLVRIMPAGKGVRFEPAQVQFEWRQP